MNDRAVALLEQYEIGVRRTRKGRGAILCETDQGLLIFKEYVGTTEKLEAQDKLLRHIADKAILRAEQIVPDREGALCVKDSDGISYVLKTFCEGAECDISDKEECLKAVDLLAELHESTADFPDEGAIGTSLPENEYEKRNRELKRVRKYLLSRSRKTEFELSLQDAYGEFLEQGLNVAESWKNHCLKQGKDRDLTKVICHGDYKYHNIVRDEKGWFLINFEKCAKDSGVRDLYLFIRKILEKSGWSVPLGVELIKTYEKQRRFVDEDYADLYHRLAYPEKFWKIVNCYYNSRKAWIPGKNLEKLDKLKKQENARKNFLSEVFRDYADS